MSDNGEPISGPKLSIVHPVADDPLDGSGAGDAPDGWYKPDRLSHGMETPADAGQAAGPSNASRIVDHLKSVLSTMRRDDA